MIPRWATRPRLQVLSILCLQIVLALAFVRGYDRGDGYCYSSLAAELAGRSDVYTEPCAPYFRVRFGYLAPMAGSFAIFGFREWAALLPQFLVALGGSLAMFSLARRLVGPGVAPLAMLIYATLPYTLRGGGVLYADFPMFHWSTIGLALFFPDRADSPRRKALSLAASAIAFACAWLTKSSVTCLAPLLALVLIWRVSRERATWLGSTVAFLGASAGCLALEMLYYLRSHGDALHRLTALEETISNFEHLWVGMVSFQRFAVDGPRAILNHGAFGLVSWLALPLLVHALVRGGTRARLFALWYAYLFLFFNFMTTSFQEYKPIRPVPLYFLVIVQPSLLLLIDAVQRLWRWSSGQDWGSQRSRRGGAGTGVRAGVVAFLTCVVLFSVAIEWRHTKTNMGYLREAVRWLETTDTPGRAPVRVHDPFRPWDLELLGARHPPAMWSEVDDQALLGASGPGRRVILAFGDLDGWRLELESRIGRRVDLEILAETEKFTVCDVAVSVATPVVEQVEKGLD